MLPLAHVVLHVGFCSAIGRAPSGTPIALRVHLADRIGRAQVDRTFRVERGDDPEAIIEFDSAFGIYRLDVAAPKYGCATTDYLFFISGHNRSVQRELADPPLPSPARPVLLSGTAPQSFLYVQPTFVIFDKSAVDRGKPIPNRCNRTSPSRTIRTHTMPPLRRSPEAAGRSCWRCAFGRRRTNITTSACRYRFPFRGAAGRRASRST